MPEVFVGCGSNIDPELHLRQAVDGLAERFGPIRCSSVYRSPAFGFEGPDFLNLVVGFVSTLGPDEIEAGLSGLESAFGRREGERWSSRTLDLDLLLYGQRVDPARRVPRLDVLRYPFVLAPLAEIAPTLVHPVTGECMANAWARCAEGAPELFRLGTLDAA